MPSNQQLGFNNFHDFLFCLRIGSRTFVCHHTSHLLLREQSAYSELLHLDARVVPAQSGLVQSPLTFDNTSPLLLADPPPFALIVECPHREIGGEKGKRHVMFICDKEEDELCG